MNTTHDPWHGDNGDSYRGNENNVDNNGDIDIDDKSKTFNIGCEINPIQSYPINSIQYMTTQKIIILYNVMPYSKLQYYRL